MHRVAHIAAVLGARPLERANVCRVGRIQRGHLGAHKRPVDLVRGEHPARLKVAAAIEVPLKKGVCMAPTATRLQIGQ